MRVLKSILFAVIMAFPALAQVPAPQINLTGNIGCQGFPCFNTGTLVMASDANRTMTAQESSAVGGIKVTSTVSLTATRNLITPAGLFFFGAVENATTGGQSIQIIGTSGTGVTIPNGQTISVWNDGTNYTKVGSPVQSPPPSLPQQLLGFTGPHLPQLQHDSASWDSNGIGGFSRPLFINGEYWVCFAGYSGSSFDTGQAIGCAHGAQLNSMTMYSGNPVIANNAGAAWHAKCIEGADLTPDPSGSIIHLGFNGYTTAGNCDGEGNGSWGSIDIPVATFPAGGGSIPSTPLIAQPSQMQWLYRCFTDTQNGKWYAFCNGGDSAGTPVIAKFTASSYSGPYTWQGTVITKNKAWETEGEVQDPQVITIPNSTNPLNSIMLFSSGYNFGYAQANSYDGTWTEFSGNPIPIAEATGSALQKVMVDSSGDWWMVSGINNGLGMWAFKAVGPPGSYSNLYTNAEQPISNGTPAYFWQVDPSALFNLFATTSGTNPILDSPHTVFTVNGASIAGGSVFTATGTDTNTSGVGTVIIATPGSGQTNGVYTAFASGGGGTGAYITYTVAGGILSSVKWFAGTGYTSVPSFTIAAGGTPGSVVATLGATQHSASLGFNSLGDSVAGQTFGNDLLLTASQSPFPSIYVNGLSPYDQTQRFVGIGVHPTHWLESRSNTGAYGISTWLNHTYGGFDHVFGVGYSSLGVTIGSPGTDPLCFATNYSSGVPSACRIQIASNGYMGFGGADDTAVPYNYAGTIPGPGNIECSTITISGSGTPHTYCFGANSSRISMGSTTGEPLSLFAGNGADSIKIFPSTGHVDIGTPAAASDPGYPLSVNGVQVCTVGGGCGAGYTLGGTLSTSNVALGTGAGTGAAVNAVRGTDGNFQVDITSGTSPVVGGTIFTVTFTASRGHTSFCVAQNPIAQTGHSHVQPVGAGVGSATVATIGLVDTAVLDSSTTYTFTGSCP